MRGALRLPDRLATEVLDELNLHPSPDLEQPVAAVLTALPDGAVEADADYVGNLSTSGTCPGAH